MQEETKEVEDQETSPTPPRNNPNNLIFGILVLCLQVIISALYGNYIVVANSFINIGSVLTTIFVALLAIVGFGLYFSYLQRLLWTSLGFNLLITAFCIQLYPLVNTFWIKCKIFENPLFPDSFNTLTYNLYLGNMHGLESKGNTITGSIRCALALIVAFSSVIGRAGSLECLFLIVFGTVGFELNREIVMAIGQDFFGSSSVFTFGSFMGLAVAVFLTIRERRISAVNFQGKLKGDFETVLSSLFGGLFIFTLLPILAYEGDNSNAISRFNLYTGPICIILAMGSAVVTSISCFSFKYGVEKGLRVKDILNGIIAGGVVCGSASFYITTPVLALICGATAAICQFIFEHFLQHRIFRRMGLVTTYSFSLFGLQGFVGAVFAAGYNTRVTGLQIDAFYFLTALNSPGSQFAVYFISAGMGLATGIVVGLFTFCFNSYKRDEAMHDRKEWLSDDCIKYPSEKRPERRLQPVSPPKQPSSEQLEFDMVADFLQAMQ